MFTTLVGQEFRSHGRGCLAIIGLGVLTGLLFTGLGMLPVPILGAFSAQLAMLVFGALPVVVLVYLGVAYWRTMYGRRGYLTFALPVRGRTIFAAKLVHGCIWAGICAAVAVLGLVFRAWMITVPGGGSLGDLLDRISEYSRAIGARMFWGLIVLSVVSAICTIVECAAVLSIGAQSRWNHLGFGAPVIGFVLLEVVNQVLAVIAMFVIPIGVDLSDQRIVVQNVAAPLLDAIRADAEPGVIGIGSVFVGPVLAVLLGWWAVRAIERHTSLR
ncbi:hypothetical protein [uncultured Propionibacterium sp.]|uniref:hypothetical protein n=1 Tax=uncultured Propionibacterium sp. TaxID=218066 RepID=UPI00292D0C80|nr:hypothetical protein [uncultured Propionibacterium sp.]